MYPDSTARWNGRTHLWVQVGPCGSASLSCNSQLVFLPQYQSICQARLWPISASHPEAFGSSWTVSQAVWYCQGGWCTNCIYHGAPWPPIYHGVPWPIRLANVTSIPHVECCSPRSWSPREGSSKHRCPAGRWEICSWRSSYRQHYDSERFTSRIPRLQSS